MSITRNKSYLLPFVQAVTGAAEGATNGAVGAAMLQEAGYRGLSTSEAAAAGALGGAVIGFANGTLESIGLFRREMPRKATWRDRIISPFSTVGFSELALITGAAMLNASQDLSWEAAACIAVVGAGLLYIPKLVASEIYNQKVAPKTEIGESTGILGGNNEPAYYRLSPSN